LYRLSGLLAALTLAACTSLREPPPEHPAPAAPTAAPVETMPALPPPPATILEAPAPDPAPVVIGLTGEKYPDLTDRIRAGYQLEDVESKAVNKQFNFYANNPEYLDRVFGRAGPYLYHIVVELEAREMPLELALLPVVESAFEPYAYSRARASGLWQFIPPTGSRYGLKQNWWYDGRRDVIESTRAALDYLQFLHGEFDDWLLAVAAYNCGEACVARAIRANRAAGKPTDFFSLSPRLPKETRAYVPKLLAMARLFANPGDYGLEFSAMPNEPHFAVVETHGQIDMKAAADLAGISYEELYTLNPAFHRWATDPSGPHRLLVPVDSAEPFRAAVVVMTPDERMRVAHHTVGYGDTVNSIAKMYDTQPHVIRELNYLTPTSRLKLGDDLRVPSGATELPEKVKLAAARVDKGTRGGRSTGTVHVVRRGDTLSQIARRHRMNVATLAALNNMEVTDTIRAGQKLKLTSAASGGSSSGGGTLDGDTYTVRKGDTLSGIATRFGVSVGELTAWNDISSRATIRPGQKLTVKKNRG
jgi:membrane-bound lytic murein transglycosylase D